MKKKFNLGVRPHPTLKILSIKLKFAMIFFLVNVVNTFGSKSYAQEVKISLNMQNNTVEQVIDEIERQSEFYFIFNQKEIDVDRTVNIHKECTLIDEILPDLLIGTNVKYSILNNKILLTATDLSKKNISTSISENESYQTKVSGTVTDASTGEPMAGVNIQIKGTTQGTISDINGTYSISAAGDAVLVFSFIGYQSKEIAISGQSVINATLESQITDLEEVVVVGYGTQKKETLTGSVAQIKANEIQATKSTSVASAIQGKVVGVHIRQQTAEPGTFNSMISVRGFGEPLLVIDGVVRDGMSDFERLNPNDIASLSVLKDASAAIYGMNASNGVIIVTTKSGTEGKTVFNYSSTFSTKQPTTRNLQKNESAYMLRLLTNEMLKNSKLPPQTSEEDLAKWKQNNIPGFTDYDWYKEMIRNYTTSHNHNFSVEGGNKNITYFTSLGYMADHGLYRNNELQNYKKYNFRTNLTARLAEGLKLQVSLAGRWDQTKYPTETSFWLFKRIITADRGFGPFTIANPEHLASVPATNTNAWALMNEDISGYDKRIGFQYQSTIDVSYALPFIKGLTLGVLAGYDGNINDDRFLLKGFQLYDYISDAPVGTPTTTTFSNSLRHQNRLTIQNRISYNRSFAQSHNFNATLVNEIKKINVNYLYGKKQYDNVYTHDILDQGSLTNQTTEGYRTEEAYVSFLGRFNYDYKGKYLAEFSFREDGSYRYAPSKRWAFFPAFSLGWRIGQEGFIKNNIPFITDLKIRGSWGKMGEDAGRPFEYYEGYTFGPIKGGYVFNDNTLTLGMVAPGMVNENLTWMHTELIDIGLDIELWKGKLGASFDLFQKTTEGELATRISSVPNTFGATFPQENLNSSQVKGYELMISHKNTIGKFDYGISANVTLARNYLLHREQAPYTSTWDRWKSGSDGDGRIQGRAWLYQENGQYTNITQYEEEAPLYGGVNGNSYRLPGMSVVVDVNGDGVINSNDQLPTSWVGTGRNPPLQYGANMFLNYKNFDLNIALQGASMFTVYVSRNDNWGYGTRFPVFWSRYLDRWRTVDPNADPFDPATEWIPGKWEALTAVPNSNLTLLSSNRWRMDATFLRIKSLELGYQLPVSISRKIHMEKLRAFANVFNLWTFTQEALQGMDPERDEGPYTVDLTYPLMRSLNLGVEITF